MKLLDEKYINFNQKKSKKKLGHFDSLHVNERITSDCISNNYDFGSKQRTAANDCQQDHEAMPRIKAIYISRPAGQPSAVQCFSLSPRCG